MKTDLLKYNNNWYNNQIGANVLVRILWYFANLLFIKNAYNPSSLIRVLLLRLFGSSVGKNVRIKPGVNIKYPWKLKIGDNCWIGENVWIDNLAFISLDKNVCVSQGALLLTGNHDYSKSTFDLSVKPIVLEEGVWIGAQAMVCPGVICHSHSVLSARSVATKDLKSYTIYQGYPALPVKDRVINS